MKQYQIFQAKTDKKILQICFQQVKKSQMHNFQFIMIKIENKNYHLRRVQSKNWKEKKQFQAEDAFRIDSLPKVNEQHQSTRAKTCNSLLQNINISYQEKLKRKNSCFASKKSKKSESCSKQPKSTPYLQRKTTQRIILRDKKQKVKARADKNPTKLQKSKDNWLIVKQVLSKSKDKLKSQASSERINIDIQQLVQRQEQFEHKMVKEVRAILNGHKNKRAIKNTFRNGKHSQLSKHQVKDQLNLKLSNLSQIKDSLKISNFKDRLHSIYSSKKKQNKIKPDQNIPSEKAQNLLLASTLSDQTDNKKLKNVALDGVLNSFKMNMKSKQKARPKTASKVIKTQIQVWKPIKNNNSNKLIQFTGWQNEPDKYERDIFFL